MPSLFDSHDTTGNTQEMDTNASLGTVKRDGSRVAEEQQKPKAAPPNRQLNQARRRSRRLHDSGGQAQGRQRDPQQNQAQGHLQDETDGARHVIGGVGHSADQGVELPKQTACRNRRRPTRKTLPARGTRTHSRSTIRLGICGLIKSLQQRSHTVGTGTAQGLSTGLVWNPSAKPNLRQGSILQAGQDVQSRHQENHAEHRVTRETAARSRSTQSNRRRAQVQTSPHPQPWERELQTFLEDLLKIMVRAFFAERGVQANNKAWHNRAERAHATYGNRSCAGETYLPTRRLTCLLHLIYLGTVSDEREERG